MFAPPRNDCRHFSPPAPFRGLCACGRGEGISPPAGGDQRALPFGNSPPLKRWTKLFHGGFAA
ncbi:MAG: hypothetical protein HDT21_01940 [Ruminococcus sp.]|nr:hypothetical protein [Ruminococcus sp.]